VARGWFIIAVASRPASGAVVFGDFELLPLTAR
jgi:hypothetical protein